MEVLKVSSKSNPNSCAGALAGVIRHNGMAELQVVGAGALNQAIKAVAIARTLLAAQSIDLVCVPSFTEIEIGGEPRTALHLVVEDVTTHDTGDAVDGRLTPAVDAVADLRVAHDRTLPVAPVEAARKP